MRSRFRRHLGSLFDSSGSATLQTFPLPETAGFAQALNGAQLAPVVTASGSRLVIPPELSPRQYLMLLLHIGAELEHALMVEYLYAAYSLEGPEEHQTIVLQWRETILGIAKEEMGHLMTVQNLLRCLGGPLNLDREDYPWDSELYPYPFKLEPLTLKSLAKYIVAESPENWAGEYADRIRELAEIGAGGTPVHRVGALYSMLHELLSDREAIPDSAFRASTYPYQANWDEWGRGYTEGNRGNAMGAQMPQTPNVIVMQISGRDDALAALEAITTQGEANPKADENEPSHFARFMRVFRAFPTNEWQPSRNVPVDPFVSTTLTPAPTAGNAAATEGTQITHPRTRLWAHLFNIRYQMLLHCLLHTFEYPSNLDERSQSTPRGLLLHATFGEMYNLRAISMILVQSPLGEGNSEYFAGPPFQMPYTLQLPVDVVDRWHGLQDLLTTSHLLAYQLLEQACSPHDPYLHALCKIDAETCRAIDTILRVGGFSGDSDYLP